MSRANSAQIAVIHGGSANAKLKMQRRLKTYLASLLFLLLLSQAPCSAGNNKALLKGQEAGAALVRGQFERSIELYEEALAEPDVPAARKAAFFNDRGVAKWRLQRHKEAIVDFNEAVKLNPEYAAAYNNRGNVLIDLGFTKEAIKDFDRAILLSRGYGTAYNNRANAYMKLGEISKAVFNYSRASEYMPASGVPLNGRGKAHLAAKRYHTAIRDFSRAISLNGKYLAAYINRAQAYNGLKDYDSAIRDLGFAIVNQPNDARLYTERGTVQQIRGKNRPAWNDFNKALQIDENNAVALAKRAKISAASGKYKGALKDLDRAIEVEPTLADAYAERAFAYFASGASDEAFADAEKAIELDPDNPRAYVVRARIQESLGDQAKAVEDFKNAFSLNPEMVEAKNAVERLTGEILTIDIQPVGEPLDGWEITKKGDGYYVASNAQYNSVEVPLEMYGGKDEQPRLLEWTALKQRFQGVGLLRYYAGTTKAPERARIENIAVIDMKKRKVASIEPFKWGARKSTWDWKEGSVVVTDHLGGKNEVHLRRPLYASRGFGDDYWGGQDGAYDRWVYVNGQWVKQGQRVQKRRKRKRKKSFFELLFN